MKFRTAFAWGMMSVSALAAASADVPFGQRRVEDAKLIVQLDYENLTDESRPDLLAKMNRAGADGLEIAFIEFFTTGEARKAKLGKLSKDLSFFGKAGFEPTVWTTTYGYGDNSGYADFVRRFSKCRMMRDLSGRKWNLVCTTDEPFLASVCENIRDIIRAGARFILLDDDLVQATRPALGCVCDEHLRLVAKKLGRDSVSADEVRASFTGAPNPVRTAVVDVLGETLMNVCRRIRAAADEIDPSVGIGLCLSDSMWDLDGIDLRTAIRLLAGRGRRPFVRLSGATYWPVRAPRYPGLGLGAVVEFIRVQKSRLAGSDFVVCDENDTWPRNRNIVPAGLCELYDRASLAIGGLVRMKYILRGDLSSGTVQPIDPAYLDAHLQGREEGARIARRFSGLKPFGFRVWQPERSIREETLPEKFIGQKRVKSLFMLPMSAVLLSANGAPVQYSESASGVAFGRVAALSVPKDLYARGLVLDRAGAQALAEKGVALGLKAPEARRIGEWTLGRSKDGCFAVCDRSWYEFNYAALTPTPVPVAEIWQFFNGRPLPISVPGGQGLFVIAAEGSDGRIEALVCNGQAKANPSVGLGPYGSRLETVGTKYDGWSFLAGPTTHATGFFRVEKRDGRWRAVDPVGRGFRPMGCDHVSYLGLTCEALGYAPYHEYCKKAYPNDVAWMDETTARLKSWGFNLLGNGEYNEKMKGRGFAYMRGAGVSGKMCQAKDADPDLYIKKGHCPGSYLPNMFSPRFVEFCEEQAKKNCAPVKDDPWLFGYYIDNELAWWCSGTLEEGLFDEVMKKPPAHSARIALERFVNGRPVTKELKIEFLHFAARKYFKGACAAIRRQDPNHLILGCRFAGLGGAHEVVWKAAGEFCDVVTFNCYPYADLERGIVLDKKGGRPIAEIVREMETKVGKPIYITEWSFLGLDTEKPCKYGAGQRLPTQKERAKAVELFLNTLIDTGCCIGWNYFMWVDLPTLGTWKVKGEDGNYGLVRENGRPYEEVTDVFRRIQKEGRK